ncbi:MAG: hypothetical protein LBE12_11915 [Planctomycetaceae bacterium]|nr:hypothetical protein [Planctomycetaceae bacterium]
MTISSTNNRITDNINITDIVQKILADLKIKPEFTEICHKTADNSITDKDNTVKDNIEQTNTIGLDETELLIDSGHVISLGDIKRQLDNNHNQKILKIVIPSKSILTPSAKDEIKKRGLGIIVQKTGESNIRNISLWLAEHGNAIVSPPILKKLQAEYYLTRNQFINISEIVEESVRITGQKKHGVILTQHPATALRVIGLCESLRVIIAIDPKQVYIDAKEINANLMIVSPTRINELNIIESIKQFTKQFVTIQ